MEGIYDIKSTATYKLLSNLLGDNTIDNTTFSQYLSKLTTVHQYMIKYMEMEKVLVQNLQKIKEENNKTLNEYTVLQSQQNDLNDRLNSINEECRKAKAELSEYENTRLLNKQYTIERMSDFINELKEQINNTEKDQIENLKRQINTVQDELKKKSETLEKLETEIKNKELQFKELQNLREKVEYNNEQKKKRISELKENIVTKKNEIQNAKKGRSQNEQAMGNVEQENNTQEIQMNEKQQWLAKLKSKIDEHNTNLKISRSEYEKKNEEFIFLEKEEIRCKEELDRQVRQMKEKAKKIDELNKETKSLAKDGLNMKDLLNKNKNKYNNSILELKEKESYLGKIKTEYEGDNNELQQILITKKNLLNELKRMTDTINKLKEGIENQENKKKDQEELREQELAIKEEYSKEGKNLESVKDNLFDKLNQIKKNIKDMKNLRENISRTVQRLEDSTRSVNEEINIKELIYLEMTKKNEELKTEYKKYQTMYETVVAERNKNFAKIQNANQRRAEMKEKLKIINTEMDTITAELSEINLKLQEKDKDVDKLNAKRNKLKQEINKFNSDKKEFKEQITKLTNENEKLHTVLNLIESDMVNIRIDYELACENRNFTGIQLIDRNDELCVFYEKIQHIETDIKELHKKMYEKEAQIKTLSIENEEVERFIEVNRKKIPQIPTLSNKIKELDNDLNILNKTLEELIKYIESPENNLKNELPGEDPDIDYLKMKYDQLADMLNEKKEQLLEKELINEEINDIAQKLRDKALENREKNIETSEKMNEYMMRLNDITRKNIACTSELSMFKAILYKLENTKSEKEKSLEEANERMSNNMPPTDDCLEQWQRNQRIDRNRKSYVEKRKKEVKEKEDIVLGVIPYRKKPETRPTMFLDEKTGLPLFTYSKNAPFKRYPTPPNLRHYKNMKNGKFSENTNSFPKFNSEKESIFEL